MKASELNGTHLGHAIQIRMDTATVTDVVTGISHEADLIQEPQLHTSENMYSLGRRSVRIQFQRMGSINVAPGADVQLPIERAGRG